MDIAGGQHAINIAANGREFLSFLRCRPSHRCWLHVFLNGYWCSGIGLKGTGGEGKSNAKDGQYNGT
jgi:hypothetical protein